MKDLHPEFKRRINLVLDKCETVGLPVGVHCGVRTFEEQAKLYDTLRNGKRVTYAKPGRSWHQYALACDIVFKYKKQWSWLESHNWKLLGQIGKAYGLIWGGDFKTLVDRPHFEWHPGIASTEEALKLYQKGGLVRVWKALKYERDL